MIRHEFDSQAGILKINPLGRIEKKDFDAIASEVDPFIEKNGELNGILLTAKDFPYWRDLEAAIAHFKFVYSHHQKIKKVAVVSDDSLLTLLPHLIGHFVSAEVRHFSSDEPDTALAWVKSGKAKP